MLKPIVKDIIFLSQPSEPAGPKDKAIITDLMDTLQAHSHECVGMAANMMGYRKRIIIVADGRQQLVMVNPVLLNKEQPFTIEEGCLSLTGVRPTTRYEKIKVAYLDAKFRKRQDTFTGWTAQIIQHECDHLEGIII